ncbi:hypothetical protein D908_15324 [Vibrio mimicus CAIM 602]|nr:hypothetical protein D908_15324 [Vibrio mimicus CAIM 602]
MLKLELLKVKRTRRPVEQTAYVYLGGKFPVEMKIGLDEGCYHMQSGFIQ